MIKFFVGKENVIRSYEQFFIGEDMSEVIILDMLFYEICIISIVAASAFLALLSILRHKVLLVPAMSSLCLMAALLSTMYVVSPNAIIIGETTIEGIGSVNATIPTRIQVDAQQGQVFKLSLVIIAAMYLIGSVGIMPALLDSKSSKWKSLGVIIASSIIYIISLSIMSAIDMIQMVVAIALISSCVAIILVSVGIITVRKVSKYAFVR